MQVQVAAKYLTGEAATWGEGDWDGVPLIVLNRRPVQDCRLSGNRLLFGHSGGLQRSFSLGRPPVFLVESLVDMTQYLTYRVVLGESGGRPARFAVTL